MLNHQGCFWLWIGQRMMTHFVLHVRSFQPVAEELVKTELPKFTDSLRENRANYAYREWLGREVERSGVMAEPPTQTKKSTGPGTGE